MIRKSVQRFSEKIMLNQEPRAMRQVDPVVGAGLDSSTDSSTRPDNRFSQRYLTIVIALFAAMFVPLLVGLEWIGLRLGATIPLSTIARDQERVHKLLWLGAFRDYAPYKLERIKILQPEVLLVGSSRCGQAREQMFRPYKTYNACLTAWPLDHVVDFIDRATREARPRVVIIALDYFLFGDPLADAWRKERTMDYRQRIDSHRRKLHDVIDFADRTNWNLKALLAPIEQDQFEPIDHNRLVGHEAIRGHFGFRSDGSIFVAPVYRDTSAFQLAKGAAYVASAFPGAQHLSETQFKQVERLSQLATDRDFSVIAIQFPFLKAATDFMDTDQSYWQFAGLWRELRGETTARRFANLGIRFFDMSRDPLSADTGNFFDPAHPSERGMLRTIVKLLDRNDFRELFPQIDKGALEDDLQKSVNSGEQFDLYH
jgi:hypothetical protein